MRTPPAVTGGGHDQHQHDDRIAPARHPATLSRQTNFVLDVCLFADRLIGDPARLPWPGTQAWMELSDDDKQRAIIRAGVVATLDADARQAAMVQAAQAVRDSADWGAVARRHVQRDGTYIPRRRPA